MRGVGWGGWVRGRRLLVDVLEEERKEMGDPGCGLVVAGWMFSGSTRIGRD